MSMFEPNDGIDEELSAPRARWVNLTGAGLAVALLVALAVALVTRQHGKQPVAAPTTAPTAPASSTSTPNVFATLPAPPSVTSAPTPTFAPDHATASQVLVAGRSFGEASVDGSAGFLYYTDVQNISHKSISISYPIRLLGPGNAPVPLAFAGVYAKADVERGIDDPTKLTRLTRVRPLQTVEVLLRVRVDCSHPAATTTVATQPNIAIALTGYDGAAQLPLESLVGTYRELTARACAQAAS